MMKRSISIIVGILFVFALPSVGAQSTDRAYFTADKTTSLIGEPIELVLHILVPQNAQLILPDFSTGLSPFTVENVGSLNLVQQFNDASVEYEVPLRVILWRTGKYQTPFLTLSYQLIGTAPVSLTVETLEFEVASVLNDNDLILRPFKSLLNLPYFPIWQVVLVVIVALGLAALFGRKYLAQMRGRNAHVPNSTMIGHPEAVYALKVLRQIGESSDSPLATYVQVSDCLRYYLSKRYLVPTLDLTTSELVEQLIDKAIFGGDQQQKLTDMLKRADLVKFARVVPRQEAAQQFTRGAAQWIQSVEQANGEQAL